MATNNAINANATTPLTGTNGGTGVNNGASTITVDGNVHYSGAFPFTGTLTASTSVTYPTSGILASNTGGGTVNSTPKFKAQLSALQSINSGAFTKVHLNTVLFDTGSYFDPTTNFRYTPLIAGYYNINALLTIIFSAGDISTIFGIGIYKNGAIYSQAVSVNVIASSTMSLAVSDVIQFNGSTDYVELFALQSSGAARNVDFSILTYLSGSIVV